MFEQWSERRRRWFLLTFCAVSWTFFANSLAHLGEHIGSGGIGADAVHAIGLIGTVAMWTAIWGALKLRMQDWVFALLCGVTVSAALTESGLRDAAAAATWSAHCDAGNGQACRQLARYYDAGRSPIHGWLDAQRLHEQACRRGVTASCNTVAPAPRHGLTETRTRCLDQHVPTDCRAAALAYQERGELDSMYEIQDYACTELEDVDACASLLTSGYHKRRLAACEVLSPFCRTSSGSDCSVMRRRCERISSPHAGVD